MQTLSLHKGSSLDEQNMSVNDQIDMDNVPEEIIENSVKCSVKRTPNVTFSPTSQKESPLENDSNYKNLPSKTDLSNMFEKRTVDGTCNKSNSRESSEVDSQTFEIHAEIHPFKAEKKLNQMNLPTNQNNVKGQSQSSTCKFILSPSQQEISEIRMSPAFDNKIVNSPSNCLEDQENIEYLLSSKESMDETVFKNQLTKFFNFVKSETQVSSSNDSETEQSSPELNEKVFFKVSLSPPVPSPPIVNAAESVAEIIARILSYGIEDYLLTYKQRYFFSYPIGSVKYPGAAAIYNYISVNPLVDEDYVKFIKKPLEMEEEGVISRRDYKIDRVRDLIGDEFVSASVIGKPIKCIRCEHEITKFSRYINKQELMTDEYCWYHEGRERSDLTYSCCNRVFPPCVRCSYHLWYGLYPGLNEPFDNFHRTQPMQGKKRTMYTVRCGLGFSPSDVAMLHITVIDVNKKIVFQEIVNPCGGLTDCNTSVTYIESIELEKGKPFEEVQQRLLNMFPSNAVLLGHELNRDLRLMKIIHHNVADVSVLYAPVKPCKPPLYELVEEFIGKNALSMEKLPEENSFHQAYYRQACNIFDLFITYLNLPNYHETWTKKAPR